MTADVREQAADPYDASIDLAAYARLLWRAKWWIAAAAIAGGAIAIAISVLAPPPYQAGVRVRFVADSNAPEMPDRTSRFVAGFEDATIVPADLRKAFRVQVVDPDGVILVNVQLADSHAAMAAAASLARDGVRTYAATLRSRADVLAVQLATAQADLDETHDMVGKALRSAVAALDQAVDGTSPQMRSDMHALFNDIQEERAKVRETNAQLAQTTRNLMLRKNNGNQVDQVENPVFESLKIGLDASRVKLAALEAKLDMLPVSRQDKLQRTLRAGEDNLSHLEANLMYAEAQRDRIADAYGRIHWETASLSLVAIVVGDARLLDGPSTARTAWNAAVGIAIGLFVSIMGLLAFQVSPLGRS